MANFSATVLKALKAVYTKAQLETERARLAAEVLSGVQITSLGMDNANGSGQITASPQELLEMVQRVIDEYDAVDTQSPGGTSVDFSCMTFGS